MAKTISQQVLDDFMATLATNPNADRKQLMQAFPEFGNDEKLLDAAYDYRETRLQNPMADMQTINSKFPEFFGVSVPDQPAGQTGVSGGSQLSEQEELARQNAIQGVTDDPYRPHVEQKQPNAFQTFYKGLGAGVINTANGLLGFLNRANSGRLAYDPVTLQQMAKQGKSPEEIEQAAQATRERLDNAETERYNAWKEKADQLSAEAKPDGGEKSFTDYIAEGKIGKALQLGLGTAAESLPYTVSALNPVATASMILSMSEQNYRQSLIDNPDMSDGQRLASAAGNAAIEMAVEHIGNPFKVFKAGKLTAPNATKWIKQVVKESKDNIYKGILRVLGFGAKEAGKEGLEEVITTAGQDLYNTLLDWKETNGLGLQSQWKRIKEQNPNITPEEFAMYKAEGLTNDFIGGALAGMMMSGPSTGVGVARAAKYYSKNGGSEESRAQAQQQLAVLQQLATEFDVTEEEVAQAIVDYQAEKQLTPKQQALINRGEEIITNLQNSQSATQATEPQETTPLSPAAEEYARVVNEVTQSVRERTHGNGYIYSVSMPGKEGLMGNIVGEVVPVIDESNPEQLRIENDDIVTVKWSDGTVTQERARDLDLIGDPMQANEVIDADVENQMYAYTQQRIQNGEQPVLMRNGEGILEGFFLTEGGLLEDQNGVQYTPEQLAEQGWKETKPVLFVNDQQQIAALDNGDGTYTQVDALGNPIAEPMSAEAFREQGFAIVPVEQAPEVQQPEVQEPVAPVVPNIETMSAADYAGAAVEYMGSREYVDEYLDGEIKKVQQQLGVANRKKVGNVTDMADFKFKKDAIDAEKKALQDRLDKLTEAREKAKSYLTIAEREARAKAEAERRAAEEAARIAREQAAAAEAARLEQERIDREIKKGVPDFSEDNDRDARARGFHVQNGVVIRRQEPLQPLATGKATTVQFAKGDNGAAEAHHVLIPISQAQPSHINGQRNPLFFISEAQPKDRRDQVSKVTSDMMAQNIHPDEIIEGATAYVGAPVLNNRGEAVQGNNRLDALIKMYQSHPESVAKYKQYLIDNAAALGYTEVDIETIKNNDVIDVRMLDNVTDEQAIQLGQKKATDLETGGVQLIDPQVTASQLGDKIQRFSEVLLKSEDDEATLADLVLRNGKPALEYLQRLGIINDAQMQSAFDSRGNITAEAKAALQGVLKQVLFQNVKNDNLPILFDAIPLTAQKAILQTIVRDLQTKQESRLAPHIQEAIEALYDALQDNMVKEAKTEADVRRAMQSWASQIKISADSDAKNLPGSEKFSNFARELATLFKYGKQKEIANKLDSYYNAVQGTKDMFGETPAISFDDAVKQVFGIEYKPIAPRASVSLADIEARLAQQRAEHRQELDEYLSTIADSNHPFVLFGNDNFIELLTKLGASQGKIDYVKRQLALGKTFEGFKIGNRLYLNADGLPTTDKARSKYVHERQHLLTTPEQIERVMRAASRDDLDVLVERLSESDGAYSNEEHDVLSEEFISFAMEVAYDVDTDAELEAALKAIGANDELINIIKEINNEQRANDQRLGQSERLSNARRHASINADTEGRSPKDRRDTRSQSAVVGEEGLRPARSGSMGTRVRGKNQGSTDGAGLSEVSTKEASGEAAGESGTPKPNANSDQEGAGVGEKRGLGEVKSASDTEIGGALVDRLGDMGLNVSTDLAVNRQALKEAKADKSEAGTIHYFKTPSGQQYGFSYKGKVYLDPTKINAELPLHEYGHLWAEALRRLNPENWHHVVDTIKADKDAWGFVKSLRPELTDENEIAEEVIATFSGKNGAEKMRAEYERMHGKDADYKSKWGNIFQNISKAIQDFWKAVGDFLNIKYESAEQVYDQVLKDFVDNMNPWKRVSDFLRQCDAEYVQAAESGDIKTATNLFYDALKENIGNGITPYMSVGTYTQLKRLAKGVKTRNEGVIKEAAAKIAPLIPDNAVLIPAPSHDGRATDMLDLAKAVAEITGSEVADVLRSAPRESQYQAKKATGVPMASGQLGITMEGTLPEGKTPIVIDNVVDSGNTAEACVQAVGRAVVVTIGDSAEQYRHAASLKSAAPVLRDKAGKVIPLSKRFDLSGSRYLGRRMYLSSNDPRFAISGTQVIPVTDKTLVGLHNISAEKLRKALKAGGLANPSAAVIDIARQNHHNYGEVSLVLSSNMVENSDGTYAGDAWTPMYPQVEYRQGKQTEKRIKALVKGLPKNLADGIYYRVGEYMDRNRNSSGLEYLFLKNKGEDMPILTNKRRYPDISIEDIYKRLGLEYPGYYDSSSFQAYEQLPEDQLFEFNLWLEKYGREADIQRVKDMITRLQSEGKDQAADALIERYSQPLFFNYYDSIGYRILRDERDAGEENIGETLDAADRKIDELGLRNEFEDWKQQMIDSFGYDEVLFAGWTSDGDRRYVKNTVENASRLMNKESETNYLDRQSVNETKAMLMDKLRTLSDIRKHKGQLEPDDEKIREAYEQASNDWGQLGIDFRDYTTNEDKTAYGLDDNPFTAIDTALARLQEAMFKRDPIAFLNREYRYSLPADSEFGTRLKEMTKRIKNLPSRYFETKFRRPVYLNEFANAVVPNDLPQDLRAGLENAGLRLFSYDPNAQGSRRDATLEATSGEGIRFAISGNPRGKGGIIPGDKGMQTPVFEGIKHHYLQEMESIKNNALNDGTFMQAPNGKPTNLDERQWLQVRTRAFKRWFGDWENDPENASKVLDANGEPMVVFHGRSPIATFTEFRPSPFGSLGVGIYFAPDRSSAEAYSRRYGGEYGKENVIDAFLNMRNPLYSKGQFLSDAERAELDKHDGVIFQYYGDIIEINAHNPNQIKSATNNNGDFSEENDDIRFSISNQNNDIFYSNAERAVESIKQEKATPEQWRAMIEKAGGLKAGEDKWIGLSDWLAQQRPTVTPQGNETRSQFVERATAENKRFTLSKQDLLDYIREHKIQIEETHYQEGLSEESQERLADYRAEFDEYFDEAEEATGSLYIRDFADYAWRQMADKYGDDFESAFELEDDGHGNWTINPVYDWGNELSGPAKYFLEGNDNTPINSTRLDYTTEGLENKREIALTVPTIESWNEDDEIHFGDAGDGRAIAWVRFGDATDEQGNKTLVIDEIQSKRHQEGREKGYKEVNNQYSLEEVGRLHDIYYAAEDAFDAYINSLKSKYGTADLLGMITPEERAEFQRLGVEKEQAWQQYYPYRDAYYASKKDSRPTPAPFEKNWHELAMKRILRFAAENGYDKVAWTTGDQQAARYDLGKQLEAISVFYNDETGMYDVHVTDKGYDPMDDSYTLEEGLDDEGLKRTIGKDLYNRVMEQGKQEGWTGPVELTGDDLVIGTDGMRGFYDDMLPRFMQKYGKKWGVQVGEVTMPQLEDGYQTMHAIDINDAMRESVMEGQPMFSISGRGVNGTMKPQDGETRSQYIARVAETVKNMTPRNTTIDDAIRFSITVNHNSPYLLKKADGSFVDPETGERLGFDHRFMGKGEGGQAHGWGSYFSARDIRQYADQPLMNGGITQYFDVDKIDAIDPHGRSAAVRAIETYRRTGIPIDQHLEYQILDYQKAADKHRAEGRDEVAEQVEVYVKEFKAALAGYTGVQRHHYSVDIPDNTGENYLEEDKQLTQEQVDRLREQAKKDGILKDIKGFLYCCENLEDYPFRKFLSDITTTADIGGAGMTDKEASEFLSRAGFVGIHYDGRRDGECYVIFNPDDAVITNHIRFSVTGSKNSNKRNSTFTGNESDFDDQLKLPSATNETDDQIRFSKTAAQVERELAQDGYSDESPIRFSVAYHGTGADFDKFLKSKINTGEGSQAFGWGLYFTDAKEIAEDYAKRQARMPKNVKDAYLGEQKLNPVAPESDLDCLAWVLDMNELRNIRTMNPDVARSIVKNTIALKSQELKDRIKFYEGNGATRMVESAREELEYYRRAGELVRETGVQNIEFRGDRNLYTVSIPEDNGMNYFEWNAEIDDRLKSSIIDGIVRRMEQMPEYGNTPGYAARIVPDFMQPYHVGGVVYQVGTRWLPKEEMSEVLAELGYKGIKYDAGTNFSQGVPEGAKNYVVFDDKDIEITEHVRFSISGSGTMKPQTDETRKQYIERVAAAVKRMTPRSATIDDAIRFSITVNHNSPYLLKKADGSFVDPETGERLGFDHRFMGKGEGGQAHGWGTYLSVNDLLYYAENGQPADPTYQGLTWKEWDIEERDNDKGNNVEQSAKYQVAKDLLSEVRRGTIAKENIPQFLKSISSSYSAYGEDYVKAYTKAADEINIADIEYPEPTRHHYTVAIPDNDGTNYLDEIKTLPKPLRRKIAVAVRELPGEPMPSVKYVNYTGGWRQLGDMIERNQWAYQEIRDRLFNAFGGYPIDSEKKLSKLMSSLGFVGVHYDGRRDGECYVIFDENDAVITDHIRFAISGNGKAPISAVTEALVKQANDSFRLMQSALKKVSADLRTINAIRTQQFEYDRKVVDMLLDLYNSLLQENSVWAGYMPDTTRRIATQIVHAIGKKDISAEVNTIMDHMVHAQAKAAQRQWDKLRQTPIDKINISGVVMQGKVALQGQHALKAMNEALDARLSVEQLEDQIAQLMDMEDNATDESLKLQYKGQWIGYTIAAQHLERIQHLVDERNQLDIELQAARSNRAIKPSARQQLVVNIKQAMRDNFIAQADAYAQSAKDLAEYVTTQEEQAKDFIHRQDANRDKIRSYAQRDLEGLATNPNRDRTRGNIARQIWDAFASPIRDLQSLLRLTGMHAPDGEGYLYNHFMRGWMDGADKERLGIVNASKTLDAKISELTHGKYKTWEDAARKIDDASHNMFTITMLNGVDGKDMPVEEEIPLNAGNALYIYAVNKMTDGRMKLAGMNITEEDVKALTDKVREQFGQEILDVVDWVQSEYFSQLRNRYNPTHEALFGAPMDAIENYFPLRINANARQQNEDLSEPDTDAARLLAGTSTGAIKRRTKNSLPLDVRNADFFQEVIRHISQMERWNAFAQWNRDANILFSDINFRNRIKGMNGTIYGSGDKLYNYMKDAFRVAIGTYKPKTDTFSEITLNVAKGVTSAKINFRIWTAMKQIASFPAFFTYMQDGAFVGSYLRNWLKPHETMKWAKEHLPNFEKRVSKRDMGDMRLMQRTTDWQWNKRILELSSKYGMYFNVLFDTLTCATGARAVYDSRYAEYIKKGYSLEQADQRARQDAEQAFNTSQQSSEGAFMSAVQMDRNLVTAALTVFRTSPIQYTRNFMFHTRNLLRKFGRGSKDEQIAFRIGQYKNDGLSEEQARKAAEKDYNKSIRSDIAGFVVYGALLNILWRLVGQVPYLLFGDDDDKKKQILDEATSGGAWFSPFTGLLGGGIVESALDGNGSVADMFAPEMPFTQDVKRAGQYLENDKYAEFANQALSVAMQSGTGFDPQTAADMVQRIVTTIDSEEELSAAEEAIRISQALLSIPQSQYEQQLVDRVVADESEYDAALADYIRYQKVHTAPLTWWLRGEESDEKAEENAEKRFGRLLNERDALHNPEDYEE